MISFAVIEPYLLVAGITCHRLPTHRSRQGTRRRLAEVLVYGDLGDCPVEGRYFDWLLERPDIQKCECRLSRDTMQKLKEKSDLPLFHPRWKWQMSS